MLNAYPDSLGGNLGDIVTLLKTETLQDVFSSFYILPSLYHSDLDRGFSVIDYDLNEQLADREDLDQLKDMGIDLKLDFILNHASAQSPQFRDLVEKGEASAYRNFFIDWNGIREAYVLATENDACNGVAMLFGHLLTNRAQIFSDVRTYWSPEAVKRVTGKELTGLAKNGIIHLINSGATTLDGTGQQTDAEGNPTMKPSWEITEAEVEKCLEATTWYPANRDYFRGGGFSSNFLSKGGMPVTMSRLNLIKGLGPVLQIAEGWTVEIDPEIHKLLDERTDRTWPTTWFVPRLCDKPAFKDVYSVMNNWGANHGAISYGHIGQDLITLASILRIPVCMHNVEDDKIFRPAAWNAFGMDKEGADYRACQNYGPIYK